MSRIRASGELENVECVPSDPSVWRATIPADAQDANVIDLSATDKRGTATRTGGREFAWGSESGWRDLNPRNLPPPKRALYQAELHPGIGRV